jgi:plastocyanin
VIDGAGMAGFYHSKTARAPQHCNRLHQQALAPIPAAMARNVIRAVVLLVVASPSRALAVPVTSRTPNIDSPEITSAISGDFVFDHRFMKIMDKVINTPTFTLDVGLLSRFSLGVRYSSNSDVNDSINELEVIGKVPLLYQKDQWVDLTGIGAYSNASGSADFAVVLRRRIEFISILVEPRFFSDGYGQGGPTLAGGVGVQVHINRYFQFSGDINAVLAADHWDAIRATSDQIAWSAAMAFLIPQTPHSFSFYVTNGNTVTLEGESRGTHDYRLGFSFDVPLTGFSRWASILNPPPETTGGGTVQQIPAGEAVEVEMVDYDYKPTRLTIKAGTTVRWTNHADDVHTATADDHTWDSGDIAAGASWTHRFDKPGEYSYFCKPHPTMRGVIVVQ